VDDSRIAAIKDWTVCANKSDVQSFLSTVGVLRIFIRNCAHRAHHLVKLTRKDIPWEWGEEQEKAIEDLREAVIKLPALKPLDYESETPVILAVDTSCIALGYCYIPFHLTRTSDGIPMELRKFDEIDQIPFQCIL
jgi:hypothetical protein